MRKLFVVSIVVATLLALWGPTLAHDQTAAVAVIRATSSSTQELGQRIGYVWFTPNPPGGTLVEAKVWNLEPNSRHGFHIHQWGDFTRSDAVSAGGHYAPRGHQHGAPDDSEKHVGDLGNLVADEHGNAHYRKVFENLEIDGREFPILGRAVIVHQEADTFGQPTGNAGARIACGVIGRANPGDSTLGPDEISFKKPR